MIKTINTSIKKTIFFLFLTCLTSSVFSQGATCSAAVSVTVNGTCPSGTISDATVNDPTYSGACTISPSRDGWYSFSATATTATVVAISNNRQLAVVVYSNTCASLVQIGCANANTTAGGQTETINLTGLTIGATYYVRIINESANNLTLNSLCITSPVAAPTNDACSNATSLPCGTSNLAGTTVGAVSETAPSGCASAFGVWYTFTGNGQSTTISSTAASGYDHEIDIFSGSCGSLTNISCVDGAGSGGTENYSFTSVNGTTYYVYVAYYTTGSTTGAFTISRTCTSPPANDDCSGAYSVAVNSSSTCTSQTGGTVLAATASGVALGSCFGTADDDVWYSFVATSTTHSINITNVAGSVTDMYHSVYSGSCGSLSSALVCSDPDVSFVSGLTIGNTYYIRVYTYTGTSGQTSTFSVCVTTPPPPPANDNCSGAYSVSVNSNSLCASTTTATSANATQSQAGCTGTADDDVWFSFVASATTQSITVTPGTMNNAVFEVFTGTCAGLTTYSCVNNTTGATAESSSIAGLTIGTTYFVRVYSNANGGGTGTFSVCINIPPPPPANDDCTGAYSLTVNSSTTCTSQTGGTLLNSTASAQTTTCNATYDDDDVWYSFVATSTTHSLSITNVAGNNTDLYHSVFSGSCGSISAPIVCEDNNSSLLSGLTVGTTYFVRVYTWGTTTGANTTFSVCVTTPPNPCSTPTNIASCGSSISTTFAAGDGIYASSACGFTTEGYEKIFTYTPPTTGNYNIQQASSFDYIDYQIKPVSAGCSATGWTCIDDITGAATSAAFTMTAGVQYYILLDPESNLGGSVTFSIICAPTPPANDNCTGAYTVSVNSGTTCTSQTGGTLVGATASSYTNACSGTADDDVWYSFVATSTTHSISINNVAGSTTDLYHSVYAGTCGTPGAPLVCSDPNSSYIGGLTIGQTYFIRIFSYTSTLGQTSTFSVCVTTIIPPNNDECTGAYPVTVNSGTTCTSQTGGTLVNASGSNVVNACGGTADDDVWYSFVATAATHSISINNVAGSTTDLYHSVFAGSCGTLSAAFICSDPNTSLVGGLTVGQTYYIRIFSYTSTFGQTSTFSVCVTTPTMATPPTNNNCSGALTVTTNTGTTCTTLTGGTLVGATSSTIANTCGGTADDDVWYSFVATSTSHSVTLQNVAGSTTDLYHSVYGGTCGSVGPALVCSDPNSSAVYGLTIGNVYYIRVFSYTSTFGQTSTFSVCVTTLPPTGPCGNPINNDYCSNPASLTQGVGTFSSSTSSIYSADQTSNMSGVFCGSIENNSWYTFVATGTTATFPFTSVAGCTNGWGVQGQVFSVTSSSIGCCNAFTSMSNCYNPGTTTLGTVTATGLTPGQSYILMIDGNAGDVCNFTISGWTATGILPIELLTFVGRNEEEKNKIEWVTATEKNTNYFRLEKSKDGVSFETLLDVNAAKNSGSPKNYAAFDMNPFEGISYYRLNLFNLDGSSEYSNVIAINNGNLTNYISNARPNPTKGEIEFDVNTKGKEKIRIELYNNTGAIISSEEQNLEGGYKSLHLDLNKQESGIYLLKVIFESTGKSEIQKIIKN